MEAITRPGVHKRPMVSLGLQSVYMLTVPIAIMSPTPLPLSPSHAHTTPAPHAESERANGGDMAHSPSGSHAAPPSIGDEEAFTYAAAEDGGDSKLSALLFGTTTSPAVRFRSHPHPSCVCLPLGSKRLFGLDWWLLMRNFQIRASFEECLMLGCGD